MTKLQIKATEIRANDFILDGYRVAWAQSDAIFPGRTEVRLKNGRSVYYDNNETVTIQRP